MKKNETGNSTPTGATRNTAHDMGQITPSVIAVVQEQMKQVARQITAVVQSQTELMNKAGKVIKEGYDITVFDALGEDWREQFDEEQLREIERRGNFFFREWERTDDKEALKKEWEQKIYDAVMANPPCAQKVWETVILREAISRTREAERDGTGNSTIETPKAQHGANTGQIKPKAKRGRPPKKWTDVCKDPEFTEKLRGCLENKNGKEWATVFCVAFNEGLIKKPAYNSVLEEFGAGCSEPLFYKTLSDSFDSRGNIMISSRIIKEIKEEINRK